MDCIIIATKVPVVGLNMHKIFRNKLYFYRATTLFQQSYPTPAKRPRYSVLNKETIKTVFDISIKLGG
jgi:dTDP-4-dehydrorhamnose reductase